MFCSSTPATGVLTPVSFFRPSSSMSAAPSSRISLSNSIESDSFRSLSRSLLASATPIGSLPSSL